MELLIILSIIAALGGGCSESQTDSPERESGPSSEDSSRAQVWVGDDSEGTYTDASGNTITIGCDGCGLDSVVFSTASTLAIDENVASPDLDEDELLVGTTYSIDCTDECGADAELTQPLTIRLPVPTDAGYSLLDVTKRFGVVIVSGLGREQTTRVIRRKDFLSYSSSHLEFTVNKLPAKFRLFYDRRNQGKVEKNEAPPLEKIQPPSPSDKQNEASAAAKDFSGAAVAATGEASPYLLSLISAEAELGLDCRVSVKLNSRLAHPYSAASASAGSVVVSDGSGYLSGGVASLDLAALAQDEMLIWARLDYSEAFFDGRELDMGVTVTDLSGLEAQLSTPLRLAASSSRLYAQNHKFRENFDPTAPELNRFSSGGDVAASTADLDACSECTDGFSKVLTEKNYAAALSADGVLYFWGRDDELTGVLGGASLVSSATATDGLGQVTDFDGADSLVCAIAADAAVESKSLYCRGTAKSSLFGGSDQTTVSHSDWQSICSEAAGVCSAGLQNISVTNSYACVSLSDSTVACWGEQSSLISLATGSAPLAPVSTPTRVAAPTQGVLSGVTQIVSSSDTTLALTDTGSVFAWGRRTAVNRGDETQVIEKLGAGKSAEIFSGSSFRYLSHNGHTGCAVTEQGELDCWGTAIFEILGEAAADVLAGEGLVRTPLAITKNGEPLGGVVRVSVGRHFAAALHEDGSASVWGTNTLGHIGGYSPGEVIATPSLLSSQKNSAAEGLTAVSVGQQNLCAVHRGVVSCIGRTGLGPSFNRSTDDSADAYLSRLGQGSCIEQQGSRDCQWLAGRQCRSFRFD